jgi:hypothetical protein
MDSESLNLRCLFNDRTVLFQPFDEWFGGVGFQKTDVIVQVCRFSTPRRNKTSTPKISNRSGSPGRISPALSAGPAVISVAVGVTTGLKPAV